MDTSATGEEPEANTVVHRKAFLERLSLALSLDSETRTKAQQLLEHFYAQHAYEVGLQYWG